MSFLEKIAYLKRTSPSVDALQVLGKQAAGQFVNKDCESMTEAVSKIVSNQDLNRDQIERVAQFANQSAWKSMFVEGGDINTNFEPADFNQVIEASATQAEEVQKTRDSDYFSDVDESWRDDGALEDLFQVEKVAYPMLNPNRRLEIEVEKLASAVELTEYALNNAQGMLELTGNDFYREVKQAFLGENAGVLQMANALAQITGSEKFASAVMDSCSSKLRAEGIKINRDQELVKAASEVIINTEHPMLLSGYKMYKAASVYRKAKKENYISKKNKESKLKELKDKMRGQ